eukprot:scaffold241_cov242-Pinguiococcus_pyrenoidosus.AAC.5
MSDWAKEEFEKQLEAVTAEKKSSLDQGNILDALHGISSGDLGNPESLGKMLAIMQNVDIRITKVKVGARVTIHCRAGTRTRKRHGENSPSANPPHRHFAESRRRC